MNMNNKITDSYRNSRRNTSFFSGISIAWAAAQFEIEKLSLGPLGEINLIGAAMPIVLLSLCVYSLVRCTTEYMMQDKKVRRWRLAQFDYRLTLYLTRLAVLVIAASTIARTTEMVIYITLSSVVTFISFFVLVGLSMFIVMPSRMFIRGLSGRKSVASAAIESVFWSMFIVGILYLSLTILTGLAYIQPFGFLGKEYSGLTGWPIAGFSLAAFVIMFSFFLDERFLKMVYAYEPLYVEKEFLNENGEQCFTSELNSKHPEYEKYKKESEENSFTNIHDSHVREFNKSSKKDAHSRASS